MIVFHIAFMTIAIIGLIISVKVFPKAYGRSWKYSLRRKESMIINEDN
jgi:hypothetical protein